MKTKPLSSAVALLTLLATNSVHSVGHAGGFMAVSHSTMSEEAQIKLVTKRSLIDKLKTDFEDEEAFKEAKSTSEYAEIISKLLNTYYNESPQDDKAIKDFVERIKKQMIVQDFGQKVEHSNLEVAGLSPRDIIKASDLINREGTEEQKQRFSTLQTEVEMLIMAHEEFNFPITSEKIEELRVYAELRTLLLKFLEDIEAVK